MRDGIYSTPDSKVTNPVALLVNCKSIQTTDNPNPQLGANNGWIISAKPRVGVIGCPVTFAVDEYITPVPRFTPPPATPFDASNASTIETKDLLDNTQLVEEVPYRNYRRARSAGSSAKSLLPPPPRFRPHRSSSPRLRYNWRFTRAST